MKRINGKDFVKPIADSLMSRDEDVERAAFEPVKVKHPYILRLKGGKSCTLQCYSKSFWGFRIHWVGDHSEPHYRDPARCAWCLKEMPLKERYYLFGWNVEEKQKVFLEFTRTAADVVRRQVGPDVNMRGLGIRLTRTASDNGRLNVFVLNGRLDEATLPADEDPVHALRALWRLRDGVEQPGREFPGPRHESVADTVED